MGARRQSSKGEAPAGRPPTGKAKQAWAEEKEADKGEDDVQEVDPWIDSQWFTVVMVVVVCSNLVTIGLETDFRHGSWPQLMSTINNLFLLAYISEIALRFHTHGFHAINDKLLMLEIFLAVGPSIERIALDSSFARALCGFRLLRSARKAAETRMFRESKILPVLLATAGVAFTTLFWLIMLMLVVVWGIAAFAYFVIGETPEWNGTTDPDLDLPPFAAFDNHEYFGSVMRSFLTLFQVLTLSNWADLVRRILEVYPRLAAFFLTFVMLMTYGMVMSIVGVVTEASIAEARCAKADTEQFRQEARREKAGEILEILAYLDVDCDGMVSVSEVQQALLHYDMGVVLRSLNCPKMDAEKLVQLFDIRGESKLHYYDFVDGIVRMEEELKTKDYVRLLMWMNNLLERAKLLSKRVESLAEKTTSIRIVFEQSFRAITYFQTTRESTELKTKAVKAVRSAIPDDPPKVRGWEPPKESKFPPEDQAKVFLAFAANILGSGKREGQEEAPRRHAGLSTPPQKEDDASQRVKRLMRKASIGAAPAQAMLLAAATKDDPNKDDKYWVTPNPVTKLPGASVQYRTFKEELGKQLAGDESDTDYLED